MKHALCIGINDYPGTDMDLGGCVNDANDWGEVLLRRGFSVESLLDSQATLERLESRMRATISEATYGDTVVITFSGHGTWLPDTDSDEPDSRDEALCPHDVMERGPLSDDTLFQIFSMRTRGVKLVMISDSCHSGSVARFANFGQESPAKVRFLAPETFLDEQNLQLARRFSGSTLKTLPGRSTSLLLAGCRDFEFSYDTSFDGKPNGVFTYVALKVLEQAPETLTYRDWMREIRRYLPSQNFPQSPQGSGTSDQRNWKVFS